jgi:hypothetical protein
MVEEIKNNEKERITLEYTAKGLANWTISVKEENMTTEIIQNRLKVLDDEMRKTYPVNVISGGVL